MGIHTIVICFPDIMYKLQCIVWTGASFTNSSELFLNSVYLSKIASFTSFMSSITICSSLPRYIMCNLIFFFKTEWIKRELLCVFFFYLWCSQFCVWMLLIDNILHITFIRNSFFCLHPIFNWYKPIPFGYNLS